MVMAARSVHLTTLFSWANLAILYIKNTMILAILNLHVTVMLHTNFQLRLTVHGAMGRSVIVLVPGHIPWFSEDVKKKVKTQQMT